MACQFWSKHIAGSTPYVPGEQPTDGGYIKLNTNENPYPPSPLAAAAIQKSAFADLRKYPDNNCRSLRAALAQLHGTDAGHVFVGNGSDEILAFLFLAFFGEDKPVLFPDISYSFYPVYASFFQVPYQAVPVDDALQVHLEDYSSNQGCVLLANPNAPTGQAISAAGIEALVRDNPNRLIIIDEAYADFGEESVAYLVDQYDNLLVVRTFSKSWSLAGLRVGYALGHPDLIAGLELVKNSINSYTLGTPAQKGATAALSDMAYHDETVQKIIATRAESVKQLNALGFHVLPSSANFVFATHPSAKAADLYAALKQRKILVRHFKQPKIENYLRITIGTDEEMAALSQALREILDKR